MSVLLPAAAMTSLLLALAGGGLVRRYGPALGLVDRPGSRKTHPQPVPTAGGLAVWLAVAVPLAAAALWWPRLGVVLAGGTALVLVGLVDDWRGLDWRWRLGVQTVVAAAMVATGWRLSLFLEGLEHAALDALLAALSIVWIVGLVNSFNMLDNMDGLSAGVGAIAAGMLAALMLIARDEATGGPQWSAAVLLLVLAAALVGFLWHNRPPARLFMGDSGSYLIGYLLAVATLGGDFAGGGLPRHAILAPLCVLAVPLYDTVSVVGIRLRQGRSPFVGDQSHFSHRLVELGMSRPQAVLTIYLATATCGLSGLLLHRVAGAAGAVIVVLSVACVLVLIAVLETAGRRRKDASGRKDA